MFGIKTFLRKKILEFPNAKDTRFPYNGSTSVRDLFDIWKIQYTLKITRENYNLGWLQTPPHPIAVRAYQHILEQNPNHLGNWFAQKKDLTVTQRMEKEVILNMIDLYRSNTHSLEGYMTAGTTEANIFAVWTGAKFVKKRQTDKICLLHTSFTHYSVPKAADIANIQIFLTPLHKTDWNMDPNGLMTMIGKLYRKNYRGFLIPLTLGYTQTGINDNIDLIVAALDRLSKRYPDISFYVWIDAALNGLTMPFLSQKFTPFRSKYIQALAVDFAKTGLAPYPAGILIYRKELRKHIAKTVSYLPETDCTILGSRPGAPAVSVWSLIHFLGRKGYMSIFLRQIENKNYVIRSLRSLFPHIDIYTQSESCACGVIFNSLPGNQLPKRVERKYGLYLAESTLSFKYQTVKKRLYKLYFLPHIQKSVVNEFIRDLESVQSKIKQV